MSHELTQRASGLVEMAYSGDVPWHGLGQELTAGAPIEVWVKQAGMDWLVKRSRVRFGEGEGQKVFEDHHVLFRSDSKEPLGIVGKGYKVVQPVQVLEFFRDLVADSGFTLHTAGTLFGGRKFWALASINESAPIFGSNDYVDAYLLLTTSCDGSMATTAKFTTVRVVCNNTLSMALSSRDKKEVSVSHKNSFDHRAVKAQLGIATGNFAKFVTETRRLARTHISHYQAELLTAGIVKEGGLTLKEDSKESTGFKQIMYLFQYGKGNHGETVWDWLNGCTEYVDHVQRARSESNRLASSWYGKGDAFKTLALERAIAI